MDVYCANCQEPWDSYHLMHDAIHECDLPERDIKAWRNKLAPKYRKAFAEAGYQFAGSTVCALLRCPCCPKEAPLRDNIRARQGARLLPNELKFTFEVITGNR